MTVTTPAPRQDPPMIGDERELLTTFLDFHRDTVRWKCAGLTDEQAQAVHLPSELTTIAGLLGHLTYVEQYWFDIVLNGAADPWQEAMAEDRDAEFRMAMETPVTSLLAAYSAQCEASRRIVAELPLDHEIPFRGGRASVRWVLIHMVEETARHAGHLDVLRELTDGATGE